MGRRNHNHVGEWEEASTANYFLMVGHKCDSCDHVLGQNEKFWRRETQVSWIRGDDEVETKCVGCKAIEVVRA